MKEVGPSGISKRQTDIIQDLRIDTKKKYSNCTYNASYCVEGITEKHSGSSARIGAINDMRAAGLTDEQVHNKTGQDMRGDGAQYEYYRQTEEAETVPGAMALSGWRAVPLPGMRVLAPIPPLLHHIEKDNATTVTLDVFMDNLFKVKKSALAKHGRLRDLTRVCCASILMYFEQCRNELGTQNLVHQSVVHEASKLRITESELCAWGKIIRDKWQEANIPKREELSGSLIAMQDAFLRRSDAIEAKICNLQEQVQSVRICSTGI